MSKHTPGPWYVKVQAMNHTAIFKGEGLTRIKIAQACSNHEDARLIAAAPEMLTWLQWALKRLPSDVMQSYQYEKAMETFAKATGEQHAKHI